MSKLRETLESGAFPVVVELKPPKGAAVDEMLAVVKALAGRVTAFSLPDNEHANLRLSAIAAARLVQEAGGEALVHFTCRDRNRLALESDLWPCGTAHRILDNVPQVAETPLRRGLALRGWHRRPRARCGRDQWAAGVERCRRGGYGGWR